MNKILRRPVAIVLLAGILVTCFSCVRDKIDMAQQDGDIDLHITIKQSEESRLGRAKVTVWSKSYRGYEYCDGKKRDDNGYSLHTSEFICCCCGR